MSEEHLFKLEKEYILNTYKRFPIIVAKAKGKYLWDIQGKKYLDMFSGISVCNMGHNHPEIVKAIKLQLKNMIHVSNFFYLKPQIELAKLLIKKSFGSGKVFFSNSGAEANECAIKLIRKYGSKDKRYEIIAFQNSFHGRTIATLSSTGQEKFRKGFKPLLPGFKFAKFNDINSVKKLIGKKTCGIIIEPVQGEGGVYPAKIDFLQELRYICDKNNLILVFDEIQCGLGRLATLFAYQYFNVKPDIITLAKSLAGGLPLGATVINEKYSNVLLYGEHASTFGGNPVSCKAAISYLNLINKETLGNIKSLGNYFIDRLVDLKSRFSCIKEARGIGLMLGLELNVPVKEIVNFCLKQGVLVNSIKDKIIRFLPPFIINKTDIDYTIKLLSEAISKIS